MSIVRITTVVFNSEQAADAVVQGIAGNIGNMFPSAEQLMGIKSNGNTLISMATYESQQAMEKANAEKDKVMSNPDIVSMETVVGNVEFNHFN